MPNKNLIVAVRFPPHQAAKLVRFVASRDGSFSISAPYHPAKTGRLLKFPTPQVVIGHGVARVRPVAEASVAGRVKLSVHSSGFIQFSAAGTDRITSGRARFSIPKGIGIHSQSFLDPIDTGSTCGATFFDFTECEPLDGSETVPVQVFEPQDFIERDQHDHEGRHIISVACYIFPGSKRKDAYLGAHGWMLDAPYSSNDPEGLVTFRVWDLQIASAFLGILVLLRHGEKDQHGGYMLTGPKELGSGHYIAGEFPDPGIASGEYTVMDSEVR